MFFIVLMGHNKYNYNNNVFHQLILEPCFESESGRNGECLPLKKCPEKLKHYREWKKVPQICDATKRTICCPEVFERTSTTTMRPPERVSGKSN